MIRRHSGTRGRNPSAAQGLGRVLLLLGLLLMHIVGMDHTSGRPSASHADTHVTAHQHTVAGPGTSVHADLSPLGADETGVCFDDGCGMEMSMAGLCIVALLGGGILLHRISRSLVSVPGQGLPAPPLWRPVPAIPIPPSLVHLSISRT
ncbi:hypothetical protein NCCP1664_16280 [Zafaria cholistanensis]|uniref:Uncharacterized protein n=1 Tax=Zafaria cholistanensis TaxID=1682741 RepID=A0A5A7NSJ8_9MICC|nr:DUF6153 family protein [Zafaria cholistanensis]GER23132.1 hypothetical protein NCCP1664_16280 [Zafaria cholistanensis]